MLANAAANVMAQFDLQPDPKTQAIIGLVMAAGTVYGPRAYLIQARRSQEKEAKRKGHAEMFDGAGAPVGTTEYQVNGAGVSSPPLQ